MRKTVLAIFVMILVLSACGQAENVEDDQTNYEEKLEGLVGEYEYPTEFSMSENLEMAITQLALTYEKFDAGSVNRGNWRETFIAKFIQNSRASFDYLDSISEENGGKISVDELNYMQYSLTKTEVDFSTYVDGYVDCYDTVSFLNYGQITGYDYECEDNSVVITAGFEVGYDGTEAMHEYKITAELIRNPYSCFDGYSVLSVSAEPIVPDSEPDNHSHTFYGTDMMDENNGVFLFEFTGAEDDLKYRHFVSVDLTQLPEQAAFVRENVGKDFKITFIWSEGNGEDIEHIVPIEILLDADL